MDLTAEKTLFASIGGKAEQNVSQTEIAALLRNLSIAIQYLSYTAVLNRVYNIIQLFYNSVTKLCNLLILIPTQQYKFTATCSLNFNSWVTDFFQMLNLTCTHFKIPNV